MFELGYLVYENEDSYVYVKNIITKILDKLGYSDEMVSKLVSSIDHISSCGFFKKQIRGFFFCIQKYDMHYDFCCRMDFIGEEIDISAMQDSFDIVEQVSIREKEVAIYLRQKILQQEITFDEIMQLRKMSLEQDIIGLKEEIRLAKETIEKQEECIKRSNQSKLDFFPILVMKLEHQ